MSATKRTRARKSKWSWWHLFFVLTGGGAGIGGWQGWDYLPTLQALLQKAGVEQSGDDLKGILVKGVEKAESHEGMKAAFAKPGTFIVRIKEVRLDPTLFKGGHTVDIQARVIKKGINGKESDAWESKTHGTRLAVVGRDELATGWPNAPFEVVWTPGDRFLIEVFDRKAFFDAKSFLMEPNADPNVLFPLQSGMHTLTLIERNRSSTDPSASRIAIESIPKNHEKSSPLTTADAQQTPREPRFSSRPDSRTATSEAGPRDVTDRNIKIR